MFGLLKQSKNTVTNPKCLIASIGESETAILEADRQIYENIFADVEIFRSEYISEFFDFLHSTTVDILHIFGEVTTDYRIHGESGISFFANISKANVKILILASENHGDNLIPFCFGAVKAGAAPMNLVMTLDRKGDSFGRFFGALFRQMVTGKTMPQAWVALSPQGVTTIDVPETIFSAGYGSLKLAVE